MFFIHHIVSPHHPFVSILPVTFIFVKIFIEGKTKDSPLIKGVRGLLSLSKPFPIGNFY